MPIYPVQCEGCPTGAPSRRLTQHDLYMPDRSIIVATLCSACIAVDDASDSDAKMELRNRVRLRRRLESQGRQEQAE
jgi:hypothetical protein